MCENDSEEIVGTVEKLIDSVNRCNAVEVFLRFMHRVSLLIKT